MDKSQKAANEVLQHACNLLGTKRTDVWTEDITKSFHWVRKYRLLWVMSRDRRSVVMALLEGKPPLELTHGSRLANLSTLLKEERGKLSLALKPVDLATAIRRLTVEPPGFVGCPEFLRRPSPPLRAWLQGDVAKQETLFRSHCAAPVFTHTAEGGRTKWTLKFSYFNQRGGVEAWTVEATDDAVLSANSVAAVADGTFVWPFE